MNLLYATPNRARNRSAATHGDGEFTVPGWIAAARHGDRVVTRRRTVTEADLVLFSGLSGDRRVSGPGDPDPRADADCTGPLVLAYAFGLLNLDPAEARVSQLREVTFHRRLRPGDTIHLEGDVETARGDETIRCLWRVVRGDGKPIARFQAALVVKAASDAPSPCPLLW